MWDCCNPGLMTRGHLTTAVTVVALSLVAAVASFAQEPSPTAQIGALPRLQLQPQPNRTFLVRRALVRRVPGRSTVIGRCRGPGCRVSAVRRYVAYYTTVLSMPRFRGMRARPGTRIELLVSHPTRTGIVGVYKFGRSGVRNAECEVAPGSFVQDC
jgi:hypothetical protein